MRRIVLPLAATSVRAVTALDIVHAITTADVRIAIEIVIHVDVDIAAAPTATPTPAAAPRRTHGQTNTKRDGAGRNHGPGRGWIINRRIRIGRSAVHDCRVVRRHINNLRIRLLDHNYFFALDYLRFDFLLLV